MGCAHLSSVAASNVDGWMVVGDGIGDGACHGGQQAGGELEQQDSTGMWRKS